MDPSNLKGNYVFISLLFWHWSSLIDAFMFKWYEMSTFWGHLSLQGLGFSILYLAKSSYHSVHFASSKNKCVAISCLMMSSLFIQPIL